MKAFDASYHLSHTGNHIVDSDEEHPRRSKNSDIERKDGL